MKKVTMYTILLVSVLTFSHAGSVTPFLGMRFNDIANTTDVPATTNCFGLKMELSEGVYTGFDSNVDGTDFRIFVEQSFGKVGLGSTSDGQPTFSVGTLYNVYGNLNAELEYMMNQFVDEVNDQFRLSLTISF